MVGEVIVLKAAISSGRDREFESPSFFQIAALY